MAHASNAFGLIQCLPSTLARLGYTLAQVKGKYGEWQLEHLVLPYLKPYVGKMNCAYDVYLAIFSPVCLGKSDGYVIALEHEKAYRGNLLFSVNQIQRFYTVQVHLPTVQIRSTTTKIQW